MGAVAAAVTAAVADVIGTGVVATAIGTGVTGAMYGAGIGAITSAISGGDPLKGAEGGAISGAVTGGFGSALGGAVGSTTLGYGLAGAAGGALGSAATGGDPLMGAVEGGAAGALTGAIQTPTGQTGTTGAATGAGGAGSSAAALGGTPAGAAAAPMDLTMDPSTGAFTYTGGVSGGDTIGSIGSPAAVGAALGTSSGGDLSATAAPMGRSSSFSTDFPGGGSYSGTSMGGPGPISAGGTASPSYGAVIGTETSPYSTIPGTAPGTSAGAFNTAAGAPYSGVAGASAPPAAAPAGTDWSKLGSDPLGTLGSAVKNNPQVALGALGMGYNMLKGDQMPKGYDQLQQQADQLAAQGRSLTSSALNQSLPPAAQAQLSQAGNAMKAQIRNTYAQMGLSGSTMEAQAMAGVDQQIAANGYGMIQSLVQQGVQESNMAATLYAQLMNANAQQAAAKSQGIGNFASALGGAFG